MPLEESKALIMNGNSNLLTRKLNATATDYIGDTIHWEGLVSVNITFTQSISRIPADNNPAFRKVKSVATGSGTVELVGIKISALKNILSVMAGNKGVRFGSSNKSIVPFGISFDENVEDGSKNKFILFNCNVVNLPSITTTTKAQDNNAKRNITLNIECEVVFVDNGDNTADDIIYAIINSKDNAAEYALYKDSFTFPTKDVTALGE